MKSASRRAAGCDVHSAGCRRALQSLKLARSPAQILSEVLMVQSKDGLFQGSLGVEEFRLSKGRCACITETGSGRKLTPAHVS